jgi:hypothetical protein
VAYFMPYNLFVKDTEGAHVFQCICSWRRIKFPHTNIAPMQSFQTRRNETQFYGFRDENIRVS